MSWARYLAAPLTPEEWNTQVTPIVVAIEELSQGKWDPHAQWQPIFESLNRIESMLKLKRADSHGLIDDAQQVFVDALNRERDTGARAFRGNELAILREVGKVYGDLLREVTHREFQQACAHTNANVDRIVRQRPKAAVEIRHCLIERSAA